MIPLIASILFRVGGIDQFTWCKLNQKWWRWLMGLPIALIALVFGHGLSSLLCILTYYIATNIPYSEKSFLNFLGEYGKFAFCGCAFGLASFPILGYWAIIQGIVGGIGWCVIKYYDDKGQLVNPWTELLRGGVGCLLMLNV